MSSLALRRWFARHPVHWVLALALGLGFTLGGAQVAAAVHSLSHAAASSDTRDAHSADSHGCATCLMAAALGGSGTAPPAPRLLAPDAGVEAPSEVARDFIPRVALAYASRAPPRLRIAAA